MYFGANLFFLSHLKLFSTGPWQEDQGPFRIPERHICHRALPVTGPESVPLCTWWAPPRLGAAVSLGRREAQRSVNLGSSPRGVPGLPLRLNIPQGQGSTVPGGPCSGGCRAQHSDSSSWREGFWWRLEVIGVFLFVCLLRWRSGTKSGSLECQNSRLGALVQINNSSN